MKTLFAFAISVFLAHGALSATLESPDRRLVAEINLPTIVLSYDGTKALEVRLSSADGLVEGKTEKKRGEWRNPFGERAMVRDDCNALAFGGERPLEFRCYNEGFCWKGTDDEGTEFAFYGDWRCWPVSHAQGHYAPYLLSDFETAHPMPSFAPVAAGIGEMRNYENVLPGTMEGPFVVEGAGFVAALGEAANTRFAKMRFAKGDAPNTVRAVLEIAPGAKGAENPRPVAPPWRYVRLAKDASALYNGNDLVLNLNEPSKIADTSWIKPGKVLRVAKLDEETGKAAVDFVKANGMQYIELDCGWYGQEHTGNPLEPKDYVKPIVSYAKEKGVGVILYVNREPLKRAGGGIDEILPELKKWGVDGIKYGFVNVGSQRWNAWVSDAIEKAAKLGLMVDIHDEYRLTGNQRTWPNVMTVEGIHGNEEMPDASHNAALVFTRYIAGPGDYTPCWKNGRVKNSLAHQLALGVATFSPWQFLFWYQRPAQIDAENPALDVWRKMPTVWEETKALAGEIGEYAVVARKSADGKWFVAGLNAKTRREISFPLAFLGDGEWSVKTYRDADPAATNALAAVAIDDGTAAPSGTFKVEAAANGGFVAVFERKRASADGFANGAIWPDADGVHINAHGGGIVREGGRFYWFGEHKVAGKAGNKAWVGVRCYSTADFATWKNEGVALAVTAGEGDIQEGCILERPKVAKTRDGKFVMYFHLERKGNGYGDARTGIAVADAVTGPYAFVKSLRPNAGDWPRSLPQEDRNDDTLANYSQIPQPWGGYAKLWGAHFHGGQMSRDMTLFTDDDGSIYHIFASEDNSTLHVAKLSDDGLGYTGEWERISHGDWTEAPCVVKRGGWYFLLGSGCTGWRPNDARYYRARSIWGPWERMGNPAVGVNPANGMGPDKTWGGQSTCIFSVAGNSYALFDLWKPDNAIDGRYALLPIDFDDKSHTLSIAWRDTAPRIPAAAQEPPDTARPAAPSFPEDDRALSDRLLMYWNSHATDVFVRDECVESVGGARADVPTVMFDGRRSHVTAYKRPKIEDLPRRAEDVRGLFLEPKDGGPKEWASYAKTGGMICALNAEILSTAVKFAQSRPRLAFNVLDTYLRGMLARNVPTDLNRGHMQTLFGMQSMETIHDNTLPKACELYAALKPWVDANEPECRAVFDASLKKWAEVQIANGVADNNWDIMQLNNILDVALVLNDDAEYADGKGRGYYLDAVLNRSSVRNLSIRDLCAKGFDADTGIWWECAGYSLVTLKDLAKFAAKIKAATGIDLYKEVPVLTKAFAAAGEYLFPDGMVIGFGDTHPGRIPREITDVAAPVTSPFFYAPNASWLVARSGMDPANDIAFALNASLGNHMHANGISMELFARGYRIAPDAGIGWSLYSGDDYKEYYSRYPAHNTVMVNSRSDYAPMKCFHAFTLEAHGDDWATVSFRDPATGAEQRRTLAYVKDGNAAFFVDCFRSRLPDEEANAASWHDYYYHAIGDFIVFNGKTAPTDMINFAESGLYALSYIKDKEAREGEGDLRAVIPWSNPEGAIRTRLFMNGAKNRTFIKAMAPATEGLSRIKSPDYAITRESKTPVVVARQKGDAWNSPFLAVIDAAGTVADVEFGDSKVVVRLSDGTKHSFGFFSPHLRHRKETVL